MQDSNAGNRNLIRTTVMTAITMLAVSAVWYESDAYRFSGIMLVLAGLAHYLRYELGDPERNRIGWMGLICLAWAGFVAGRYVVEALAQSHWKVGAAEGIYLLPLMYPTLGHAFYLFLRRNDPLVPAFMVLSIIFSVVSLVFLDFGGTERIATMFHNNSIHAAFGTGVVVIVHLGVLLFARPESYRLFGSVAAGRYLAFFNIAAGLYLILMLNSKGVWVALVVALASLLPFCYRRFRRHVTLKSLAIGLAVIAVIAVATGPRIARIAGPTAEATGALIGKGTESGSLVLGMLRQIRDPSTPKSLRIRLEIWVDALNIFEDRPVFGAGPAWHRLWESRTYTGHRFNIMHNSYFEIAVRFGIVGFVFYGVLFGWCLLQMQRVARHGLASPAIFATALPLLIFFLVGSASNSFIRLALGESFMWLFAATGFYCAYLLQQAGLRRKQTFI